MKILALLLLLLTASISNAQQIFDEERCRPFQDSVHRQAQKLIIENHIIGAQVAVIQERQVLFNQSYGFSDLPNKIPTDVHVRFRIGSISKMFTAFAVMQLVEQGKVDLNTPIEHYLPTLHLQTLPGIRKATIKDLLTHTSGLADDINNNPDCLKSLAQSDLIQLVNQEVLSVSPGLKMTYSNIGFGLLGCLIEQVSGLRYGEYLKQHIFIPLGMRNSMVPGAMEPVARRVKGYLQDSTEIEENNIRDVAAGGIESSMEDMIKFAQMLLDAAKGSGTLIVRKETFEEMARNQLSGLKLPTDDVFGLGMFIHPMHTNQDSIIGHGIGHAGDLRLHHSLLFVYPKLGLGIVILSNSEKGGKMRSRLSQKIMANYMACFKGVALKPAIATSFSAAVRAADHIDHKEIAGTYGGGGEEFLQLKKLGRNKIKFKQGKNTLILKRNSGNLYTTKYRLLQIIPIPVKPLMFAFNKVDGRIYMKALDQKSKTAQLLSVKDNGVPLSKAWKNRAGAYETTNDCPNAITMKPVSLKCIGNKIVLYRNDPVSDLDDSIGFNALDDNTAISDGVERGSGAVLKLLPNGNLYYSGFELKPKGESTTKAISLKK
jgi:CubicO group peptidase (beta-lactamase class C family)